MVYFYSAVLSSKKGELRLDGSVEITSEIKSYKILNAIQKQLKDYIRSKIKEQEGIEIDDIVFVAFNRI